MHSMQLREYACSESVRIDIETNKLTSEQEEKVKNLFTEFVDSVKKELGE